VLRRIFGPTKQRDGTWKIKINDELDKLIRHKNIINRIRTQRLSCFGNLNRMPEERIIKKVTQMETDVNTTTWETKINKRNALQSNDSSYS
jgi:hypothetical protein